MPLSVRSVLNSGRGNQRGRERKALGGGRTVDKLSSISRSHPELGVTMVPTPPQLTFSVFQGRTE